MKVPIDDYALHFPGIQQIERECFHAVRGADDATRRAYLGRAYRLGREFGDCLCASHGASRRADDRFVRIFSRKPEHLTRRASAAGDESKRAYVGELIGRKPESLGVPRLAGFA